MKIDATSYLHEMVSRELDDTFGTKAGKAGREFRCKKRLTEDANS